MFFKRSRKRPAAAQPVSRAPARDPLDAVPVKAAGVTEEAGVGGALILVRRAPVPMRYARLLGRFLGGDRISRVVLDENGVFFWRQIDGVRTLRQIADAMRVRLNRPEGDARAAVIAFTKDLMKRNLIQLKLLLGAGKGDA